MHTYVPQDQAELALIDSKPIGAALLNAPLDDETRRFLETSPRPMSLLRPEERRYELEVVQGIGCLHPVTSG